MYKKYLVVASKKDKAGINITTNLSQFKNQDFDFYLVDDEIIYTENINLEKISNYDFIIFASKHSSGQGEKALAIHSVGNFHTADFGGEKGKVGKSSAMFQKQLFENLKKNVKKHELKDFVVTMEATHHGPLINKPCVFIEIGSSDLEYGNRRAGFIIAKTISETIESFKENPYNEVAIGIGGPHYCPNFNKLQENSNAAISHVIPQYALPLTEELIQEAIDKTEEEVDLVILDWKGLGTSEKRQELINILDKLHVRYEKTSQYGKD
jgi:D-aminoacyl-tRNA deacylase